MGRTIADGDTFAFEGFTFKARIQHDQDHGAPWREEDGHGPISDWTTRDKAPGELIVSEDRGARRFYDFAAAVRIARADGWNSAPFTGTRGQRAARAARADFERMRDWCADRWHYIGVIVQAIDEDGAEIGQPASLWGIESDAGEYLAEVAHELAADCLASLPREVLP